VREGKTASIKEVKPHAAILARLVVGALAFNRLLARGVDSTLRHHTHLVLVDRASRIRGYYSTSNGNPIPQLVADARRLLS